MSWSSFAWALCTWAMAEARLACAPAMSLLPPPVCSELSDDWARSRVALAPLTDAWAPSTCCDVALVVPPVAVLLSVAVPA